MGQSGVQHALIFVMCLNVFRQVTGCSLRSVRFPRVKYRSHIRMTRSSLLCIADASKTPLTVEIVPIVVIQVSKAQRSTLAI